MNYRIGPIVKHEQNVAMHLLRRYNINTTAYRLGQSSCSSPSTYLKELPHPIPASPYLPRHHRCNHKHSHPRASISSSSFSLLNMVAIDNLSCRLNWLRFWLEWMKWTRGSNFQGHWITSNQVSFWKSKFFDKCLQKVWSWLRRPGP